jgi:hypothetical protein
MSELTAGTIREQLTRYLVGDLDAAAFRDWFALVLRDVHKSDDKDAEPLAHAIEWAFSDLERQLCSGVALREKLSRLARLPQESRAAMGTVVVYLDAVDLLSVEPSSLLAASGSYSSPLPLSALSSSMELTHS